MPYTMKVETVSTELIDRIVSEIGWHDEAVLPASTVYAMVKSEWLVGLAVSTVREGLQAPSEQLFFEIILGTLAAGMEIGMRMEEKQQASREKAGM